MRYFIFGDVHGCLNQLKQALENAGFDRENENHTLISLGDNFDRGGLNRGVFNFLVNMPRIICIKGNHELILQEVLKRGYLTETDVYNGTLATIASFAGMSKSDVRFMNDFAVQQVSMNKKLQDWLTTIPPFFETKRFIFTHGWVPREYYSGKKLAEIDAKAWEEVMWCNTEEEILNHRQQVSANGADKYKTIVVGHWHTFRLKERFEGKPFNKRNYRCNDFGPYVDEQNKVIALDSCTNISKRVNILIEDDEA